MTNSNRLENHDRLTGLVCAGLAALLLTAAPLRAQDERTGVSHPSNAIINADDDTTAPPPAAAPAPAPVVKTAKPSAAIPYNADQEYGPYVPYHAAGTPEPAAAAQTAFDPDANIVTAETAGRHPLAEDSKDDPDAGIVTMVPGKPGELSDGTLVKVKLREELSTLKTQPGTKFTAEVAEPVMKDGKVIVPAGAVLEGRVTQVHGGTRLNGGAAIHLEPRMVVLPDGMQYAVRARAIDTDSWQNTHVDEEGTITRRGNGKQTATVMGLSAGSGAAAGAMIGGVPGAVIGAGVGAGAATVVWLKQDRQATLPKDLEIIFSLTEPMSITPAHAATDGAKADAPGAE